MQISLSLVELVVEIHRFVFLHAVSAVNTAVYASHIAARTSRIPACIIICITSSS